MTFISLSKKTQPPLILRLGKIVYISGISITRTNWDDQCTNRSMDKSKITCANES